MADITADAYAWSTTEASNPPSGSTSIGTGLDDNLRAQQAGVASFIADYAPTNLENGYLTWTVGSNILTVAVKTIAGNDPSSTDPVYVHFRNVTADTGSPVKLKITAATSIAINNTALLGTVNSVAFRLWAVGFNDGGTFRLGVINCVSTSAGAGAGRDVTAIYPLAGWGIASSTQEGDGADSAQVFYTDGAAVTSKAYSTLGYATWESGLATAGTWSAGPTRAQLWGPSVPLPGQTIQVQRTDTGAVATGSTTLPLDDSIPQSGEGDQFMSQAITPTSAANVLQVEGRAYLSSSAAGRFVALALFFDATANAYAVSVQYQGTATGPVTVPLTKLILAAGTSATTAKLRGGADTSGTVTFNGGSGARQYGAVINSFLEVREVMG
jgi:hypothetical protein